jgi:hypothetical protein
MHRQQHKRQKPKVRGLQQTDHATRVCGNGAKKVAASVTGDWGLVWERRYSGPAFLQFVIMLFLHTNSGVLCQYCTRVARMLRDPGSQQVRLT